MDRNGKYVRYSVVTPKGPFLFAGHILPAESPAEQAMPPEFYKTFDKPVPQGLHHEIVLTTTPRPCEDPDRPFHIYTHPTRKTRFVCFTGRIATAEAAVNVFEMWALGTALTLAYGEDYEPLVEEHGKNLATWKAYMAKRQITIRVAGGGF